MQKHWDQECNKPKSQDGYARIIQNAWRRFRERVPSNAKLAWNSLSNNGTSEDKKFLGIIPRKIKNPITRQQFELRLTKEIAEYNKYQGRCMVPNRYYVEYYIPYDWIGSKKSQLRIRFQKRLLELEV